MQFKKTVHLFLIIALFFSTLTLSAQTTDALGSYSPYSMMGIGDVVKQGSAYNYGMAGIGIGVRDNRYINYTNPAAITARDTFSSNIVVMNSRLPWRLFCFSLHLLNDLSLTSS